MNQIAGTIILTSTSHFRDEAKQRDLPANTFYSNECLVLNPVKLLFPVNRLFQKQTIKQTKNNHPAWLSFSVLLIQLLCCTFLLSRVTSLTQGRLNWQKWTQILIFQHSRQSHPIDIDSSFFHISCWHGMGVQERIKEFLRLSEIWLLLVRNGKGESCLDQWKCWLKICMSVNPGAHTDDSED